MSNQKISVHVYSFVRDHGDGGGSTTLYRDKEHYIKSHTKYAVGKHYYEQEVKEANEAWEKALEGDSPYEDGEIHEEDIELELVDGKWQLVDDVGFSWGQ